jgi:type III secretion protein C
VLRCLWTLALAAVLHVATAAEIHWRTNTFAYVAQNKPLKDFIRDFATSQGLSVVIAPEVSGTVNGKFNLSPQAMLETLGMSFGVTWYYDGSVLYVSPEGDLSSEVMHLDGISPGQLQHALAQLGVLDARFPISYDRAHGTARVSGPKRYVELVKESLAAIAQNDAGLSAAAEGDNTPTQIRIFPLRYAWAADFTYSADGQDHTLPGIVSVLRDLYHSNRPVTGAPSARQTKLERLRGMGYFRDEQVPGSEPERLTAVAPRQDAGAAADSNYQTVAAQAELNLPQFQADGRMNAVIVRDVPEHMEFYEQVIKLLDVKPALVEIEARVLEVSEDAIDTLGVDWRARSGSASLSLSPGNQSTTTTTTSSTTTTGSTLGGIPTIATSGLTAPLVIPNSQLPTGGMLTTVLGDSGRFLMARVSALADHGKASVLSTPRVITLDNVEAVLENLNTFYVPVAGNLDVGLYNVSAGTSLRVTPLLVTEDGRTQIKLAVRIEDGGITQQSVGSLPVVQRTTITTQAFINEGESLLIGGYKSEVNNVTKVGIPGLSSIPVLGVLFRHEQKEKSRMEHLFMLTPRVVQR